LLKTVTFTNTSTCTALSVTIFNSVMPTAEPSTGLVRGVRESPFGIASSIEDENVSNTGKQSERGKRFFQQFWNAFATGITVTTWSVISSTWTSTLAIPGASTVLPCLPAGYGICQIAVGK
jgi:hypothetical protein